MNQRNNTSTKYVKFIIAIGPKVPYSLRFSQIVSTCKTLGTYAGSTSSVNDNIQDICNFLRSVCLRSKDWANKDRVEKDIVHVLVRVPREMKILEGAMDAICHERRIFIQPRSVEDIKQDEKMDWSVQMQKIQAVISNPGFRDQCLVLEGSEAEEMMQVMQRILIEFAPEHPDRIHAFKILNSLCKQTKRFVTIRIVELDGNEVYMTSGGFGSISRATHNGSDVAVKSITSYSGQDNSKAETVIRREILLWDLITHQRHPNILPLIGITNSQFPSIRMVSPWQENGNLSDYVRKPIAAKINRLRLLEQVCSALQYLHNHVPIVIHGDLKCANVLVNQDGNPYLADFGMATVRYNGASLTTALEGGSTRWMAPELFRTEEMDTNGLEDDVSTPKVTTYSDIWSFAMLALELLTDEIPYSDKTLNATVMYALMQGERPKHPRSTKAAEHGLNHELWQHLGRCWDLSPQKRLPLHILHDILNALASQWCLPSLDARGQTQSRVTETIFVPTSTYGRIVGSCGINIKRYESELAVKIKLNERGPSTSCEISGPPENVKEARTIIESVVEGQASRVQKSIDVPRHLHRYLIGRQGARIREFETKYHVTVSLHDAQNRAIVGGTEKNVDKAIEELRQTVNLDKEWTTLRLPVTKRAGRRISIQKTSIIHATGLDHLTIQGTNESDERQVVLIRGHHPDILDEAKKAIRQICREVQDESELELEIPPDLHGLILGGQWKTWSELVLRCGGPDDPKLQKEIIEIDQSSTQVFLRGQYDFINALAKEIQVTIERKKRDVYSMRISPRYHRELRRSIFEIQRRTTTLVLLPGDGRYDEFSDPPDMSTIGDVASAVKIIGTRDAFCQARGDLENKVNDIRQTQRVLEIPLKYQGAIREQTRKKLQDMDVRILFPPNAIDDEPPVRPLSGGRDWQVISRYCSHINGVCEWTLRATTKEALNEAQTLIQKAYEKAHGARYIGFLTLPDSLKFGRIVGKNGETVQKLQQETNTTIIVPKMAEEDRIIEITGSRQDIERAQVRIRELVTKSPPRPTDRLFKPSRMNSRNHSYS